MKVVHGYAFGIGNYARDGYERDFGAEYGCILRHQCNLKRDDEDGNTQKTIVLLPPRLCALLGVGRITRCGAMTRALHLTARSSFYSFRTIVFGDRLSHSLRNGGEHCCGHAPQPAGEVHVDGIVADPEIAERVERERVGVSGRESKSR